MCHELSEIRVFAPATLANLGCGYDVLGVAIDGPGDEILIRKDSSKKGLSIKCITGDQGRLPLDIQKNTASIAAQSVLDKLDIDESFELEIHKKMPFGSGLGSSAASAVGGAFAMNQILGAPLERHELLYAAMQGEQTASKAWHADNVAPGLLGGFCLVRDNTTLDIVSLPSPDDLWFTVIYDSKIEILTSEARERVPTQVSTKIATTQAGHLGAFIASLYQQDYELLKRSVVDHIAEPKRRGLIPKFEYYQDKALIAGALTFGISGSGPSLFAICHGEIAANKVAHAFRDEKVETYISRINTKGVIQID